MLKYDKETKEEKIKIFNKTFYYLKTKGNISDKGYLDIIGLSNKNKNDLNIKYNDKKYSYLYMIQEEEKIF